MWWQSVDLNFSKMEIITSCSLLFPWFSSKSWLNAKGAAGCFHLLVIFRSQINHLNTIFTKWLIEMRRLQTGTLWICSTPQSDTVPQMGFVVCRFLLLIWGHDPRRLSPDSLTPWAEPACQTPLDTPAGENTPSHREPINQPYRQWIRTEGRGPRGLRRDELIPLMHRCKCVSFLTYFTRPSPLYVWPLASHSLQLSLIKNAGHSSSLRTRPQIYGFSFQAFHRGYTLLWPYWPFQMIDSGGNSHFNITVCYWEHLSQQGIAREGLMGQNKLPHQGKDTALITPLTLSVGPK